MATQNGCWANQREAPFYAVSFILGLEPGQVLGTLALWGLPRM